jgi:NitT/TauT family transport system ATP-binding protein
VVADLSVTLPHPRNRKSPEFIGLVDQVYKIVTGWDEVETAKEEPQAPPEVGDLARLKALPTGHLSMLTGLLELVADRGGRDDLYHLGSELLLEVDDLLPVTETAELFHLAEVHEGDLILTEAGLRFCEADALERKIMIRDELSQIPIFRLIERVLRSKQNGTMGREFFIDILEEHFSAEEAEVQLTTAIYWGRYADLFHYDTDAETLYLPEEAVTEASEAR